MGYAIDDNSWRDGFETNMSVGMACKRCGALVLQSPIGSDLHREWHEQLDGS